MNHTLDLNNFYPTDIFKIVTVREKTDFLIIELKSITTSNTCPTCKCLSNKPHGTYNRKVQDLPILNKGVILYINAREYKCLNENCVRKTFVESYHGFIDSYSRMTNRLTLFLMKLSLQTSCESASKVAKSLGIRTSPDTLINILISTFNSRDEAKCSEIIGVDDFAFKKGCHYGTIIVDGITHKPIALLDGRDEATLSAWLIKNSHVKIISRDRASAYARSIEKQLPNAMQIADRFHLFQNLADVVKDIIKQELPKTIKILLTESQTTKKNSDVHSNKIFTSSEQRKIQLINSIQQLNSLGYSDTSIGRMLDIDRRTVKKYKNGNPKQLCINTRHRHNPYEKMVIDLIIKGHTASNIWSILKNNGYPHSYSNARTMIKKVAHNNNLALVKYCNKQSDNSRHVFTDNVYLKRTTILRYIWSNIELNTLERNYLYQHYPIVFMLKQCLIEFKNIFLKKQITELYIFISKYGNSVYKKLATFANGLNKDLTSIENAVSMSHNNGFVEGVNNKLKAIKRSMYGACRLELLTIKLIL